MNDDYFGDVELTGENMDRYVMRRSIFEAVESACTVLHGTLLDFGCGSMPYREFICGNSQVQKYVGIDLYSSQGSYSQRVMPDVFWSANGLPFRDGSFDSILASEVLEHVPDLPSTLAMLHTALKPNGLFVFTVPFLWPLHEVPHDECRYTPFHLSKALESAGFTVQSMRPTGGWHASVASLLGLWACRAVPHRRKLLSVVLIPIMRYLLLKDESNSDFKEGDMILGISGIAKKAAIDRRVAL